MPFFLPPAAGGDLGGTALDLARERYCRASHLGKRPAWLDPAIDVHASRPRRLGPADQPEILEHIARHHRDVTNLRPRHAGNRIQVDPQLVRVIQVLGTDGMGIEVDATQVDDPGQLRGIAHHDLFRGPAGGKRELNRLDPLGT